MDTKAAARNRWFKGWRFAARVPHDDPADEGTAFGLDMSLGPDWTESEPQPAAPTARASAWMQWLTARRRPAI